MAPHQVTVGASEEARSQHIVAFSTAKHDPANHPRRAGPAHNTDYCNQQEKSLHCIQAEGKKGARSGQQIKQLHRISATAILYILIRLIAILINCTNKGRRNHYASRSGKMDRSWRRKGNVTVLSHWIVWRKKSRQQNGKMQGAKRCQQRDRFLAAAHARSSVRMRGSAKNRNKSAINIPHTRNRAESMTDPITTYTSRASIASSSNGPRPGQFMMTSIKSEALRSDPSENPNSEMRGDAAVGRA